MRRIVIEHTDADIRLKVTLEVESHDEEGVWYPSHSRLIPRRHAYHALKENDSEPFITKKVFHVDMRRRFA